MALLAAHMRMVLLTTIILHAWKRLAKVTDHGKVSSLPELVEQINHLTEDCFNSRGTPAVVPT